MNDEHREFDDGTALLVAVDPSIVRSVERACTTAELTLRIVDTVDDVTPEMLEVVDVIVCSDHDFPVMREHRPRASAIVYGEVVDSVRAIEAIRHGALDYVVRPLAADDLVERLRAALRIAREPVRPADYERPPTQDRAIDRIIGQSPAMQEVYKAIGRVAPNLINVLITGESGTGKELVARAIVHHSPRRDAPYLAVNCAAIPDTLLERELFGHERGAFTGADERRIGKFEQCDGGTLFLDEIGDIPLTTQAKLLRVLQDQSFQRLGGSETIHCDVRLIAATHQPLERLMEEGRFRPDLFYRLNVATINVPPLREREVDVVLLAHYFVDRYNTEFGTQIRAFAPQTLRILLQYTWPGNVRQLENTIRATLVMAQGSVLRPEFLPESIRERSVDSRSADADLADAAPIGDTTPADAALSHLVAARIDAARPDESVFHDTIAEVEREMIRAALRQCAGRIAPAAKQLGISRTTLRRKMTQYGIDITTT